MEKMLDANAMKSKQKKYWQWFVTKKESDALHRFRKPRTI